MIEQAKSIIFDSVSELRIGTKPTGFDGLDELAELLGVKPGAGGVGVICIEGKSGERYDVMQLVQAHIELMQKHAEGLWFQLTPHEFHELLQELESLMSFCNRDVGPARRLYKTFLAQTGVDVVFRKEPGPEEHVLGETESSKKGSKKGPRFRRIFG